MNKKMLVLVIFFVVTLGCGNSIPASPVPLAPTTIPTPIPTPTTIPCPADELGWPGYGSMVTFTIETNIEGVELEGSMQQFYDGSSMLVAVNPIEGIYKGFTQTVPVCKWAEVLIFQGDYDVHINVYIDTEGIIHLSPETSEFLVP